MVGTFHLKVLRRPISERFSKYHFNNIRQIISSTYVSEETATLITHAILEDLQSRGTQMIALRATAVYMLNDDDNMWAVIEWIEIDGVARIVIFHFDELAGPEEGSWLMHTGLSDDGDCWRTSQVAWNVADVEHLKILFRVVRHILGVLEWSVEDAMKLYSQIPSDDNSNEEYILRKY